MITADSPEAYGYTIFCDDIRAEVGGKLTYVGSYSGTMLVHGSFPTIVPKLALGIVYLQRRDRLILPITFWIFLPGDAEDKPSIIAEMPHEAAIDFGKVFAQKVETEETFVTLYSQFALTPLHIAQPGILKVRAVRGDQLIRLGGLVIMPAPVEESPLAPPQP
jgi:hypothetical protein